MRNANLFGDTVKLTKAAKDANILATDDRNGLPPSVNTHAANPHEGISTQLSFEFYMPKAKADHLIPDRTCASENLDNDNDLDQDASSMNATRCSTSTLKIQDGRLLRQWERRGLVKRFFAWLQWN